MSQNARRVVKKSVERWREQVDVENDLLLLLPTPSTSTPFFGFAPPPPSSSSSASSSSEMTSDSSPLTSSPKADNMDAGAIDPALKSIRKRLGNALNGRVLGHMPVKEFLDAFLPKAAGEGETNHEARMENIKNLVELRRAKKEADIYDDLATAFTGLSDNRITFLVSANKSDKKTGHRFRPNVMGYGFRDTVSEDDETSWREVDLFVEAKLPGAFDGFQKIQFGTLSQNSKDTRSQFIHYMDSQWKYQHREHGFCVQFLGKSSQVRLLRFDPAGIIVSQSLQLRSKPGRSEDNKLLAEFLYRFGRASKRSRGWSSAWETVDKNEADFESISKSLGCRPKSKITVNNTTYYAGPRRSPRFFRSRATMGYHATRLVEKDDSKAFVPCFIKETWPYHIKLASRNNDDARPDAHHRDGVGSGEGDGGPDGDYRLNEGEVYLKLQKHQVGHVPTMIFQHECDPTATDNYVEENWVNEKPSVMTKQAHRLLCFEERAKPIQEFTTVREMLGAWMDAISGYKDAIEKAGQVHRDISADNVLISHDGSGLLSDWDQSAGLSEPHSHLEGRTGTIIFMAAKLLRGTEACHQPKHDLESFYHLLAFFIYFYIPNPLDPKETNELTSLYRLPPGVPNPFQSLGMWKQIEIYDSVVSNSVLEDGTWGPLGHLLVKLRKEVLHPLLEETPTLTWQDAADKMIAFAKEALDSNHNDLSKGPFEHKGVNLPWETAWNFRESVAGTKRARSESPPATRERPKRSKSSQSSEDIVGDEGGSNLGVLVEDDDEDYGGDDDDDDDDDDYCDTMGLCDMI